MGLDPPPPAGRAPTPQPHLCGAAPAQRCPPGPPQPTLLSRVTSCTETCTMGLGSLPGFFICTDMGGSGGGVPPTSLPPPEQGFGSPGPPPDPPPRLTGSSSARSRYTTRMAADGGSGLATIVRFLSKTWGTHPGGGVLGWRRQPPSHLTPPKAGLSPGKLISGLSPSHLVQFGGVGHEGEPLQAQVEPPPAPLLQREPLGGGGQRGQHGPPRPPKTPLPQHPPPPAPPIPAPTSSSTRAFSTSPKSSFILESVGGGNHELWGRGGRAPPPATSPGVSVPPPTCPGGRPGRGPYRTPPPPAPAPAPRAR